MKPQLTDDIAISVRNVSKCYHLYENQRARLRHALIPKLTKGLNEIWALRDINFEVMRGDSFAIIGRNGSGKSTLLEIITQTLAPTTGEVTVNGRVAALLELGSGFNPEYTGAENIFLNGLLLGLSRPEIEQRFDDIAGFADIGNVLHRPVKTYSSGMLIRLAFAVQVALQPEILIVDEALSVGDYFFQQKCFGRLRQMRENGLSLLFVSHDMGTVRDLCSTAVYLKRGVQQYIGDNKIAIQRYLKEDSQPISHSFDQTSPSSHNQCELRELDLAAIKEIALWSSTSSQEEHRRLLAVVLRDANGEPTSTFKLGETIKIQVFFRTASEETGHISYTLKNRFDQIVCNSGTYLLGMNACSSDKEPFIIAEFELCLMLEAGLYTIKFNFGQPTQENRGKMIDHTDWLGPLQIRWNYQKDRAPFLGMFGIPTKAKIILAKDV